MSLKINNYNRNNFVLNKHCVLPWLFHTSRITGEYCSSANNIICSQIQFYDWCCKLIFMWTYCSFTIHLIIYTTPNKIILILLTFQDEAEKYIKYTTENCIVFNTNILIYMMLRSTKINIGIHRQLHIALFSNLIYMRLKNNIKIQLYCFQYKKIISILNIFYC